jgi:hypothetical protein
MESTMKTTTKMLGQAAEAARPNTMTELRDQLLDVFRDIGAGSIDLGVAKQKCNAAGKIIKSAAVQLEYAVARDEKPNIPFLK